MNDWRIDMILIFTFLLFCDLKNIGYPENIGYFILMVIIFLFTSILGGLAKAWREPSE